jgi:hypothetical protein
VTSCVITDCARPHHARELCFTHYMRRRRHGDTAVTLINRQHDGRCSIDGCDRKYLARGLCGMHYQRKRIHGQPGSAEPRQVRYGIDAVCIVPGCDRRPRRNWLCEMHADRFDAYGDVGGAEQHKQPAGSGHQRPDGYIEIRMADHPLARSGGNALLHRVILFGEIGPGPHLCRWCGRDVDWMHGLADGALVVDHVDHDRGNNDPSNLVASCHPCNSGRQA